MVCKLEFRFSLKQTLCLLVIGESLSNHNRINTFIPRTFRFLEYYLKSGCDCLMVVDHT